tara:strand:- start:315 stop:974 length:660 start_codon:yes stop_codon:yes gene_type:complete
MTITLPVTLREEATSTKSLRDSGSVPAVVYGPKQEPLHVAIDSKAFDKIRREAGESTIIELEGLKESVEVLIKSVDFDPVRQQINHADLYAIERGKDMTATVPIHFEGESPAEKQNIGVVTKVLHEIEVTCRPSKLPSQIVVDLGVLATLEDKVLVKDLDVEEGVVLSGEDEDPVAVVNVVKEEVEEEPEAVDMDAIEVEQKGKDDAAEDTAPEGEKVE